MYRTKAILVLTLILSPLAYASELVIYPAKKVITMEPALPEAKAVAVENGIIVAVGSLQQLEPLRQQRGGRIDRSLENKYLMPGFIDPHVHPSLPAVLTQFPFLAPDDWSLPTGEFPGARTPEAYKARLAELVGKHSDPGLPFITWGYHPLWHGEIYRDELNAWFPDTPVMLWHRSFHELIGNDAAFELIGVTAADVEGHHEIDWDKGHFYENGLMALVPKLPFLFSPERYGQGMANFLEMLHRSGITTALDMGTGIFGDPAGEIALIRHTAEASQAPSRITLTPIITDFLARKRTPEQALEEIERWREGDSHRVTVGKHFKLMLDGAIFSGLSQYNPPGYLDGHQGLWMAPLEVTTEWARFFWQQGYQLHAHTNGDMSADALIDIVRTLQDEHPRSDHRTALEHFAYTTEDQNRQMKALGMVVSANPYYDFLLSDIYSEKMLGPDRGRQMVKLGSLERLGVPFALHSDCPMGPLSPLTLAAAAEQRITINGNQTAVNERISRDAALRAITIDAAWVMGAENEIGSIRAGKRADFTVLEQDPYRVKASQLAVIEVWGTVFEGELHPVE
jgi:predicted amidohydrolase YtcJ